MPEPSEPDTDEHPSSDAEPTDPDGSRDRTGPDDGGDPAGSSADRDGSDAGDDVDASDDPSAGQSVPDDGADSAESAAGRDVPGDADDPDGSSTRQTVPDDVRNYARFTKMDGAAYDRVNGFLRDRTYVTAREWAIARLCADFRTETGVEMTKIGENLPELVPFMTDTYSPQAVNQARASFEEKVTKSGATFLYGAMSGFFTAEELDDLMYEATEVAKFLLEIEGADLGVEAELDVEDRISEVMRDVRRSSERLRAEETGHGHDSCPHCGGDLTGTDADD